VRENRPYLSHDLASEVAFMEARGTTNPRRMTVRELQTLALVAEGKPYGVIAEHLARELQDGRQYLHASRRSSACARSPNDAYRHPASSLRIE
jgi:DNA-binding NarL/FixJ family response regulator